MAIEINGQAVKKGKLVKVVIINASARDKGALSTLVAEAAKGASEGNTEVEELRLAELDIRYCKFCMACYRDPASPIGRCSQDDDMRWILPKLKEADGYIIASQLSSGQGNAIFKTFFERCAYTAGSSKGKLLWIEGIPISRFTDRRRFAVTLVTSGAVQTWLRVICDTATRQMKEMSKRSLNATVIGTLYAGELTSKGLKDRDVQKARVLGKTLANHLQAER